MTLDQIKSATTTDVTFQRAIRAVRTGQWTSAIHQATENERSTLEALKRIHTELTANSDETLLLRGNRIVITLSLQDHVIALAYEGHQGIVKTKKPPPGKSIVNRNRLPK